MAPWIFVAGRIKEGALSERSEFGSFPSPRHKSKEGVAISGAPFFCLLFFGKTKESESCPAGYETQMDHQGKTQKPKTNQETTGFLAANNPFNAPNRSFGDIAGIVSSGVGPASSPSFISAI
ncbi:hypothetical protein R76706_01550 [Ralstonia mannitolilytica]|nr:hypothetical protein R76706_01550 [Ralstonia mannitolilytica]